MKQSGFNISTTSQSEKQHFFTGSDMTLSLWDWFYEIFVLFTHCYQEYWWVENT